MRRADLEHLIRAAAAITNEYEIVVVGSQSILGAVPDAPDELLKSMAADVYPLDRPDLADLIDGSIGELSAFHETFGYYAQGVGPETAILPVGWESRLVKVQNANTDLRIGLCLEPHDLAASKLAAARDKDWTFVATLLDVGIINAEVLRERVETLAVTPARLDAITGWLDSRGLAPGAKWSPTPLIAFSSVTGARRGSREPETGQHRRDHGRPVAPAQLNAHPCTRDCPAVTDRVVQLFGQPIGRLAIAPGGGIGSGGFAPAHLRITVR